MGMVVFTTDKHFFMAQLPLYVISFGCLQMQTKVSTTLVKMCFKKNETLQHDLTVTDFYKCKLLIFFKLITYFSTNFPMAPLLVNYFC